MKMDYKIVKEYLKNVYFINGSAYAGKSTLVKRIAEKHGLFHCGENHGFDEYLKLTTPETHPYMNYFNTKSSWEEFVTRSKEDYDEWMVGCALETVPFEIIELISLSRNQKVITETNIPHHILSQISDRDHVIYMVATTEIAMNYFFDRPDREKQFLFDVIKRTNNPEQNMINYKKTIAYCNRQSKIDEFLNSGYYCIQRKSIEEDIEDKILLAEKHFKLGN